MKQDNTTYPSSCSSIQKWMYNPLENAECLLFTRVITGWNICLQRETRVTPITIGEESKVICRNPHKIAAILLYIWRAGKIDFNNLFHGKESMWKMKPGKYKLVLRKKAMFVIIYQKSLILAVIV